MAGCGPDDAAKVTAGTGGSTGGGVSSVGTGAPSSSTGPETSSGVGANGTTGVPGTTGGDTTSGATDGPGLLLDVGSELGLGSIKGGCTKVDSLFVIDDSGSMLWQQERLLAALNGFAA